MHYVRLPFRLSLLALGIALAGSPAWAQVVEAEPNSSCSSAQDLGALSKTPKTVTGSLDTPPATPDVDFYRITGTPGDLVQIDMQGQFSYHGTLQDPFLGAFGSDCLSRGYIDDGGDLPFDSRMEQTLPADGTLVIGASSSYDGNFTGQGGSAGSYLLTVQRVPLALGIGGRIVNGRTGEPVQGAYVSLARCLDGWCSGSVGQAFTGPDGIFRFEPGSYTLYESILRAGEYGLYVWAGSTYEPLLETPIFQLAEGQDLDLGDVTLTPVPVIGSIQGRLVDALTGQALPGDAVPFSWVELQSCQGDVCFPARRESVDSQGRFDLHSSEYQMIPPGTYRVVAYADQYYVTAGPRFEVAADQSVDTGDLPVKSFPVRLTLAQGCGPIPSTGGDCQFRVRVTNGGTGRLQAESWTLVRAIGQGMGGEVTQFPAGSPRSVSLASAASVDLPLSFHVPSSLQDGTTICARAYAGHRPNPFDTIGLHDLFCLHKGEQGFSALPEAQKREFLKRER